MSARGKARSRWGYVLKSHVHAFDMLESRSARSERTTTSRRRPIFVVTTRPAPSFVRPKPVTSHASSIVQVSRWANGIVLGSAAFGPDRLTCEGCPPVFSRRLHLACCPPIRTKLDTRVGCATSKSMRTSESAGVRQRRFEYFWIPKRDEEIFRECFNHSERHRDEASLLTRLAC
jgi:hypothetical protein